MYSRPSYFATTLALLLTAFAKAGAAEVDVLEWQLSSLIRLSGIGEAGAGSGIPSNPFQKAHFSTRENSTIQSIYDVSWDSAGRFDCLVDVEVRDQGNPSGFSRSTGVVYFVPGIDSVLTVDMSYSYAMAGGSRQAVMTFHTGGGPAPGGSIFSVIEVASTTSSPPTGAFTVHESIPLLAHEAYAFSYMFELSSFSGSPTSLSMGSGRIAVSIVPVPEPASSLLVVFAGAESYRRRRRIAEAVNI